MLSNNFFALIVTFLVAIVWLRLVDYLAHRGWISGRLSRKIIHIGTGPLFVLCWPLFINTPSARYLAALVPLLITIQFFLVGIGVIKDEPAVQAMSRTGNPREILRGPLFYGIIFVLITIIYWYDSPIGIVALMLLCGGDGLADILGRRYGKVKLPWNHDKSWIGSLGMFLGGWLCAIFVLLIFTSLNLFPGPFSSYLSAVTWIGLAATLVESFPIHDFDNITITITALLMGHILF